MFQTACFLCLWCFMQLSLLEREHQHGYIKALNTKTKASAENAPIKETTVLAIN